MLRTNLLIFFLISSMWLLAQKNIEVNSFNAVIDQFNIGESLVVIGEAHEVAGTYELESFIIEELMKSGYEYILYEGGVSEAILLNKYLETGDETILDFTRARGLHYGNYMKAIYEVKKKFPSLSIRGVDFERAVCLQKVFEEWFMTIEHRERFDELKSISAKTKAKKVKQILLDTKAEIIKDEIFFRSALGEQYELFYDIVFNPVFQADFGLSSKQRDEEIMEHLLSMPEGILAKSILIFGSNHFTNASHFWIPFANRIQGEVETTLILLAYKNCENLMRKGKRYSSVDPLSKFVENLDETVSTIEFELINDESLSPIDFENRLIVAKLINQ